MSKSCLGVAVCGVAVALVCGLSACDRCEESQSRPPTNQTSGAIKPQADPSPQPTTSTAGTGVPVARSQALPSTTLPATAPATAPVAKVRTPHKEYPGRGEVMGVVALDYDRSTGKGSGLNTIGEVYINERGIFGGDKGKSGWVSINTTGSYTDDAGAVQKVKLIGVSFWVNKGGANWWDFEVDKVVSADDPQREIPFDTAVEDLKPAGNRPVLTLMEKHRLVPVGELSSFTFKQEK